MNCNNTKYLFLSFKLFIDPSKIVFLEKYNLTEMLTELPKTPER